MDTIQCQTYNIYFDQWSELQQIINKDYSQVLVIVDENTEKYCLPIFDQNINIQYYKIVIPEGEPYKNLDTAKYIWEEMLKSGADRHSLCINLGGGVIGDMGGWAAAAFMRGMDFVQIPTTLLSMVDASVGGKLAIDFHGYKNLIGQIIDPLAVFIFPVFLNTLSERLVNSGYAEVVKHGLIADVDYWNQVKDFASFESDANAIIYQSVQIKKAVTEEDPMERGLRKILNFGHTLGHAIESYSLQTDDPLLHGEAIAIGMISESYLSYKKNKLTENELQEITNHLINIYGKYRGEIPSHEKIKIMLSKDKKNKGGKVMYTLLETLGKAIFNQQIPEDWIEESLQYYRNL